MISLTDIDVIGVNPPDLVSNSEQDQQTAEQRHHQSHPQHDRNLSTDQSQQYDNPYQGAASPQYESYPGSSTYFQHYQPYLTSSSHHHNHQDPVHPQYHNSQYPQNHHHYEQFNPQYI